MGELEGNNSKLTSLGLIGKVINKLTPSRVYLDTENHLRRSGKKDRDEVSSKYQGVLEKYVDNKQLSMVW